MSIEPTIARNLWFFPPLDGGRHEDGQPFAAIIAGVNDDGTVNLMVAARDGSPYGAQNVRLVQDGDAIDQDAAHAVWMPYQKGQAAKTEQLQAQAPSLEPVHTKIDQLASTVDARLQQIEAAPQDLHQKVTTLEQGIEAKFQELGGWLSVQFKSFDERLTAAATPPAPAPNANSDALGFLADRPVGT